MSPNDYLKALRMNKAAELIQGGTRISEVAAQVGFTSSSYFAKCFKAQYGVLRRNMSISCLLPIQRQKALRMPILPFDLSSDV